MKPKNVLAILGSPHSKGVTAAMLDYSIREAEKAGYNITKIDLYERQLAFCTGCRVCLTSGKYSLQGTTQGNGLTGAEMPVRFSM